MLCVTHHPFVGRGQLRSHACHVLHHLPHVNLLCVWCVCGVCVRGGQFHPCVEPEAGVEDVHARQPIHIRGVTTTMQPTLLLPPLRPGTRVTPPHKHMRPHTKREGVTRFQQKQQATILQCTPIGIGVNQHSAPHDCKKGPWFPKTAMRH